jgi:hypothetical protein
MREVSIKVALAVIDAAVVDGVAEPLIDPVAAMNRIAWEPFYLPYRPA